MGGQLTVSSQEHCGSTFTFVLPYKVSTSSDHADDPDEVTDMANHDAATDEVAESFFQFQPRTLGSLFSSEEMASVENGCSAIDVAETLSEPESSASHISNHNCKTPAHADKQGQDDTNNQFQDSRNTDSSYHAKPSREVSVAAKLREPQGTCKRQEKSDADTESTSSNISKSTSKPKILLVEDNKINVMVTQNMMKRLGHSIDVVNNGIEAVRAVQHCSYNLILMVHNFHKTPKGLLVYMNTRILVLVFMHYLNFAGCSHADYGWPTNYKNNTFLRRNWQLGCC